MMCQGSYSITRFEFKSGNGFVFTRKVHISRSHKYEVSVLCAMDPKIHAKLGQQFLVVSWLFWSLLYCLPISFPLVSSPTTAIHCRDIPILWCQMLISYATVSQVYGCSCVIFSPEGYPTLYILLYVSFSGEGKSFWVLFLFPKIL